MNRYYRIKRSEPQIIIPYLNSLDSKEEVNTEIISMEKMEKSENTKSELMPKKNYNISHRRLRDYERKRKKK
jgi:hypothetical protein